MVWAARMLGDSETISQMQRQLQNQGVFEGLQHSTYWSFNWDKAQKSAGLTQIFQWSTRAETQK